MLQVEEHTVLDQCSLFNGINREEKEKLLDCLQARSLSCPKETFVFLAGNPADRVGLVLEGAVQVIREDVFGNRALLARLEPGELFGETFACAEVKILPVSVQAAADSRVLLLDYRRIITTCPSSCIFHSRLIENMLQILARKNSMLNSKIEALSARSIRDRLLVFLSAQATQQNKRRFTIAFDRQELADYLAVDRSALSRELSRMREQGLIRYRKNQFELLKNS